MRGETLTPVSWHLASWWALCLLLALPAALLPLVPLDSPDQWPTYITLFVLHPDQGWTQHGAAWWATAWVHGSEPHLIRNLAGTALLAGMGWATQVRWPATMAWLLAWPLTHVGMLWRPELTSYVGLSGVLHAGVAVVACHQLINLPQTRSRLMGTALLTGLIAKVLMENPWGPVLILSPSSAIKVAPWAHFSGVVSGLACGVLLHVWTRPRHP